VTPRARQLDGRASWLRARRIGSSDVPRILTRNGRPLSPYGGPRAVQRRLLHQQHPSELEDDPDPDRLRGTRWEPVVITAGMVETGRRIKRVPPFTLYEGPRPWATCSPDAWIDDYDAADPRGVCELKTDAGRFRWGPSRTVDRWVASLSSEIREDYAWQAMYQAWALDVPFAELLVLLPFYDVRVYRFARDAAREADMVRLLERFYERHVIERLPLPADELDEAADLEERTRPVDERGAIAYRPAMPHERALVSGFEAATYVRDTADEQRRSAQTALLHSIGRARGILLDRRGGRVTVVRRPGCAPFIQVTRGEGT